MYPAAAQSCSLISGNAVASRRSNETAPGPGCTVRSSRRTAERVRQQLCLADGIAGHYVQGRGKFGDGAEYHRSADLRQVERREAVPQVVGVSGDRRAVSLRKGPAEQRLGGGLLWADDRATEVDDMRGAYFAEALGAGVGAVGVSLRVPSYGPLRPENTPSVAKLITCSASHVAAARRFGNSALTAMAEATDAGLDSSMWRSRTPRALTTQSTPVVVNSVSSRSRPASKARWLPSPRRALPTTSSEG